MRERFQTFILEDSTPTKNETPQGRGGVYRNLFSKTAATWYYSTQVCVCHHRDLHYSEGTESIS